MADIHTYLNKSQKLQPHPLEDENQKAQIEEAILSSSDLIESPSEETAFTKKKNAWSLTFTSRTYKSYLPNRQSWRSLSVYLPQWKRVTHEIKDTNNDHLIKIEKELENYQKEMFEKLQKHFASFINQEKDLVKISDSFKENLISNDLNEVATIEWIEDIPASISNNDSLYREQKPLGKQFRVLISSSFDRDIHRASAIVLNQHVIYKLDQTESEIVNLEKMNAHSAKVQTHRRIYLAFRDSKSIKTAEEQLAFLRGFKRLEMLMSQSIPLAMWGEVLTKLASDYPDVYPGGGGFIIEVEIDEEKLKIIFTVPVQLLSRSKLIPKKDDPTVEYSLELGHLVTRREVIIPRKELEESFLTIDLMPFMDFLPDCMKHTLSSLTDDELFLRLKIEECIYALEVESLNKAKKISRRQKLATIPVETTNSRTIKIFDLLKGLYKAGIPISHIDPKFLKDYVEYSEEFELPETQEILKQIEQLKEDLGEVSSSLTLGNIFPHASGHEEHSHVCSNLKEALLDVKLPQSYFPSDVK